MRRTLTLAAVAILALAVFAGAANAQAPTNLTAGRTFTIPLSGPGGAGTAVVTLNPGRELVCYTIEVTLTTEGDEPAEPMPGLGSAHIHVLPSGGIFIHLDAEWTSTDGTFTASECVTADRASILAVFRNPESYYVNVHTLEFPAGAVQGSFG